MSRHAAVRDPEPLKMDGHKLDRDRQSVGDEVAGTRSRAPSFQSNLWAIADLHLSLARPDRRERYAERWRDHAAKIEREWRTVVRPEDLVLLPGDLSMARNHRDVQSDLAWIDRLPGTKVLSAGNHDSWWNDVDKIRPMLRRSLLAVGGDAVATHGVVVCGTLGVPVPADEPSPEQVAASDRELAALDRRARAGRAAPDCSRAALRPLALPPLRPAPPTRSLRRAVRGGRRDRMSLRPPPYPGSMVAGRARRRPGRPLLLRGRRRDRFSTPPHRFTFAMTPRAPDQRDVRICSDWEVMYRVLHGIRTAHARQLGKECLRAGSDPPSNPHPRGGRFPVLLLVGNDRGEGARFGPARRLPPEPS